MQIEHFKEHSAASESMYGISFVGAGYQLRLGQIGADFYYTAYFALSRYPDALRAAQDARDTIINSKAFKSRSLGIAGCNNSTGFVGVSCHCGWSIETKNNNVYVTRKLRFHVTKGSRKDNDGKLLLECVSGVRMGVWKAYRKAVMRRHEIAGKRVSAKAIAHKYDTVFLPNYRERLEALELDWRRAI